jgi:hypothetical protein
MVCAACGEMVDQSADQCRSCGHRFTEITQEGQIEPAALSKNNRWLAVAAAGAVLLIVAAVAMVTFQAQQPRPPSNASIVNFATAVSNSTRDSSANAVDTNASAEVTEMNTTDMNATVEETASGQAAPAASPDYLKAAAKVEDWSWETDPDFGTEGAIKWRVSVRNLSSQPIATAKIEFSAYDADHHLLTTTFTYVENIPPGETRDEESFADFHGGEQTARVAVASVRFSD